MPCVAMADIVCIEPRSIYRDNSVELDKEQILFVKCEYDQQSSPSLLLIAMQTDFKKLVKKLAALGRRGQTATECKK